MVTCHGARSARYATSGMSDEALRASRSLLSNVAYEMLVSLPTLRQLFRRRGCAGRRGPAPCATSAPTGPHSHSPGAEPAANAGAATRGIRGEWLPSRADSPTSPPSRAGRERGDGDAHVRDIGPAERDVVMREVFDTPSEEIAERWKVTRSGPANAHRARDHARRVPGSRLVSKDSSSG